jgi:hypothetical protein
MNAPTTSSPTSRPSLPRSLAALGILALAIIPALGCDSAPQPDHSLRDNLAAFHAAHSDPNDIGSLDATAPPSDLNAYRNPTYRTVSTH